MSVTIETTSIALYQDLIRGLVSAIRGVQLYAPGHTLVVHSMERLQGTIAKLHADRRSVTIGVLGSEIVVADTPLPRASASLGPLLRQFEQAGIERITIESGLAVDELTRFVRALAALGPTNQRLELGDLSSGHIRVGRIQVQSRAAELAADLATVRRLYSDASAVCHAVWEAAQAEGAVDPRAARTVIDKLALAVAQNRTALLALTALKDYDNYTFTHMVNVSILTMAQARTLGIDGPLLREFGLAALMHDIGKVRTPTEILNKPEKLTPSEFNIMKRHTIDGAEMLRTTPETPALAPIVAFEHHLRLDGSGYPDGVSRSSLNLATMLCAIADVYDAMRSQRQYQEAFASDRILAVLEHNDGRHFDQHLVRRFAQLIGIYPPGNLVRLNTGEVAVVIRTYAPDPFRPQVRVIFGPDGERLERPRDVSLWTVDRASSSASRIVEPLDPKDFSLDPLTLL